MRFHGRTLGTWNKCGGSGAERFDYTSSAKGVSEGVPTLRELAEHPGLIEPGEIDVAFTTGLPGAADPSFEAERHLEAIADMAGLGVTWTSTGVPAASVEQAVEAIDRYGREVIAAGG